jgi:hypothetical protein
MGLSVASRMTLSSGPDALKKKFPTLYYIMSTNVIPPIML